MARFEHLPIYKKAYDLALYMEQTVRQFSRYHKYTLGSELRQHTRTIIQLIRQANASAEKSGLLLQLREELENLKLTIRLCKDMQAFANSNAFQFSINETINLSKQTEGWLKATQKRERPESASPDGKAERANR
ncbi:MAG: four helix bundle protein [Candidatus Omnitrophica bacterium]|nr:four helix bundle protein [Candidatus Omnitrophota bacterium]